MKKVIVLQILILIFSAMYANEVHLTDCDTEKTIEILTTRLNLTENQKNDIRPIIEMQTEMKIQLREIKGGDRTNIKAQMMKFRELDNKLNEKIKSHLTKFQQTQFEILRKELMKSNENGRKRS